MTNGVAPYTGTEPGTQFSLALAGADSISIQNYDEWGTGSDTGLSVQNVGAVIAIGSTGNPNTRKISFVSFSASMPSFAHSAIAPDETGTNYYSLDTRYVNEGVVNLATGAVSGVRLHTKLVNDYYSESEPALVTMDCSGTMNFNNMTLQLAVGGFAHAAE